MLVICKALPSDKSIAPQDFKVGGIYRHMPDGKIHFVNGYGIPETEFNRCFKDFAPILKSLVEKTGFAKRELLTKNAFESYKPVSKKEFAELCDVHVYGRGARKKFIVCIGHPKESMFKLYPYYETTKKEAIAWAYITMNDLIDGNLAKVDAGMVRWTNRGIPIAYDFKGSIVGEAYNETVLSMMLGE